MLQTSVKTYSRPKTSPSTPRRNLLTGLDFVAAAATGSSSSSRSPRSALTDRSDNSLFKSPANPVELVVAPEKIGFPNIGMQMISLSEGL